MGNVKTNAQFIDVLKNWRLVLLGATSLVLSLASGWTTWDGMQNFTNEPVLSLMITFGIQGVMLIVAWLIGESFATSMGRRAREDRHSLLWRMVITFMWIMLFVLSGMFLAILLGFDVEKWIAIELSRDQSGYKGEYLVAAILMNLIALSVLSAGKDIIEKYQQAARVIARNLSLWIMFIACMGASVFFSFDSLFTTIFPQNERVRAADIRIRAQVAGIGTSINVLNARRRLEVRTQLLATDEWQNYAGNLDRLVKALKKAPETVGQFLRKQSRLSQQTNAQQQEELAILRSKTSQLSDQKSRSSGRLSELKAQRAQLASTVKKLNSQIFEMNRQVIAKTAEAQAELQGIGGSLQAGIGPRYRALIEQKKRLHQQQKNLQAQLDAYRVQLTRRQGEIAAAEGELARFDAQLSRLGGQTMLAGEGTQFSREAAAAKSLDANLKTSLQQLASERIAFEQTPTRAGLDNLQSRCSKIADLLSGSSILKTQISSRTCDPGRTHEMAASMYALNDGAIALNKSCGNQQGPSSTGDIEVQLTSARRCLRLSGLPTTDHAAISARINAFERNRDDKAHRFVVTINAFTDGNKLAYLALAIAIAIDALVFVSGLFGANILRSPLSSIPQGEGRTARQLERMIENALLPDVYTNASLALQAIKPMRDAGAGGRNTAWTHELDLQANSSQSDESLRKLINAGAIIGSVRRDRDHMERYYIRGELIEALSEMAMRAFEGGYEIAESDDLRRSIVNSLRPNVARNAGVVLHYFMPSTTKAGFSSLLNMADVHYDDEPVVRRCLNAAATFGDIEGRGDPESPDRFLIGKELYKVLASLADGVEIVPEANWVPPEIPTMTLENAPVVEEPAELTAAPMPTQEPASQETVAATPAPAPAGQPVPAAASVASYPNAATYPTVDPYQSIDPYQSANGYAGTEPHAQAESTAPQDNPTPSFNQPQEAPPPSAAAQVAPFEPAATDDPSLAAGAPFVPAPNPAGAPAATTIAAGSVSSIPVPEALVPVAPVPEASATGTADQGDDAARRVKQVAKPISGDREKHARATISNDTIIFD